MWNRRSKIWIYTTCKPISDIFFFFFFLIKNSDNSKTSGVELRLKGGPSFLMYQNFRSWAIQFLNSFLLRVTNVGPASGFCWWNNLVSHCQWLITRNSLPQRTIPNQTHKFSGDFIESDEIEKKGFQFEIISSLVAAETSLSSLSLCLSSSLHQRFSSKPNRNPNSSLSSLLRANKQSDNLRF